MNHSPLPQPLPQFVSRFAPKQAFTTVPAPGCPSIAGTLEQRMAFVAAVNAGLVK